MQSRTGPMDERDLAAIIDQQISASVLYENSELAEARRKALLYYGGEETLAGDVKPRTDTRGRVIRSSVVSRDVADVHGWVLPQHIRVFLGSDRVVIYEPRRQEAEEGAKQATDYINYVFLSECDGYRVLYSAIWDALLFGNGVLKHWWDDTPEYRVEKLSGKTQIEYLDLIADPNVEIIDHTERDDPQFSEEPTGMMPLPVMETMPDESFAPLFPKLHDFKIKRRVSSGRLRVAVVPGNEFRLDPNATVLDEEHVRFAAHVAQRMRSALVSDGYKRSIVDDLPAYTTQALNETPRDTRRTEDNAPDKSTDLIEVWECYIQVDYDGDGVAEWRRVVTAAGANERQILANDEWEDELPFTDIVPDPIPHQWAGRSIYDEVADIQRIKTVFWRGINDNLYWINNPQRLYLKGGISPTSMDEFHNPTFGGWIEATRPDAISNLEVPFVADKLHTGMELADNVREFRTGVSPATMSLDPEALQNQTATAVNAAQTASYAKNELRARNIAEGLKRLFRCILKLVVNNQDQERTIRLRGEWETMNPSSWDADMDVVINVGLGSGSRDRDLLMLQAVAAKQELVVQGLGPMVAARLGLGPDKVFDTYRKMVEAAGLKSPEAYFPEITSDDVAQLVQEMGSQPDPKAAEQQAKIEMMQAEMQARMQMDQAKLAADQQANQQSAALEWQHRQAQAEIDNQHRADEIRAKAAAALEEIRLKHQLASEQAVRDWQLKMEEIQIGARLKERELELEAELKREEMAMRPETPANIEEAEV